MKNLLLLLFIMVACSPISKKEINKISNEKAVKANSFKIMNSQQPKTQ